MIVWSKGLGKQSLPMELDKAALRVDQDHLAMSGIIEPVYWQYTMRLFPMDLAKFMKVLCSRETVSVLAERRGILLPFLKRLCVFIPRLIGKLIVARTIGKIRRGDKS